MDDHIQYVSNNIHTVNVDTSAGENFHGFTIFDTFHSEKQFHGQTYNFNPEKTAKINSPQK